VFLAFGWVFRNSWGALLGLDGHLFFLALICGALRIPWNLAWKQDVAMEASRAYSVRLSIRSLLTSVAGAAWVYLLSSDRYMGQIYALLAVGGLMGALTLAILVRTARGGKWNARHLKYALLFGIPLMPHALSTFLLSLSDRVVVSHFAGYADTGLYALAYDVGAITGTAAMALNQAWLPQFLDLRKSGNTTQIAVLSRTLSISFTSICCLALLMARELMFLLGGESFRVALPVIPVVIMGQAALFLATLYANYTFYRKRTGLISLATMFAAVINVALNIWLVPLYGYAAAAWTTWFSYILLTATEYGIARFLLGEQVVAARSLLGHQLLLGAVALLVPWVESQAGNPAWLLIAKLAIALFLCWRMWQAFQAGKAMA
jgi:O-antigen/teichoic acid export membrane protein